MGGELGHRRPPAAPRVLKIVWTRKALSDIGRLRDFLGAVNQRAAAQTVRSLSAAPDRLRQYPRLGARLEEFDPREIRRVFVGDYEVRYEIQGSTISVLRIWHGREDR